jgi:hypothetical protein
VTHALLAQTASTASSAFGAADQEYLFQARQMQTLSFAAHIPFVALGFAALATALTAEDAP